MKTCNESYRQLVTAIMSRELRSAAIELTPLPTYPDTIVYQARAGRRALIFKAVDPGGRDPDGIALEAWACAAARRAGVPAPAVITLDISAAYFPSAYIVMERARGSSLEELALTGEQRAPLLAQLGQALRRLHMLHLPGFGWLDEQAYRTGGEVRGSAHSWRAALLDPLPPALETLERQHAITPTSAAAIRAFVGEQQDLLDGNDTASLLHGDLGPIHVWVDAERGELSAIVDWGERAAGDPIWDFVDYPWHDVPAILKGYSAEAGMSDDFERRFGLYALLRAIPWAARWYARGASHAPEWLSITAQRAGLKIGY